MLVGTEKLNFLSNFDPHTYQLNAIEAVKNLEYAALFHEQGLGKTKIALDLSLEWLSSGVVDTVLIVAKKGLVYNWKSEIEKHTKLSFAVLDNNYINNSKKFNKPFRLYITHYEAITGNLKGISLFLETREIGVILDESHYFKNPDGKIAKVLHKLANQFKRRVIMTGTPVANRPYDIWSQIYFLDQGKSLGHNFELFKEKYDLPANSLNQANDIYEQELVKIFYLIKFFTVRETKDSAGIELPKKEIQIVEVTMKEKQAEIYSQYKYDLYVEIIKNGLVVIDEIKYILKQMTRLIQIASNPALVDESYSETPCKITALETLLTQIDDGEKAIVWTNFIKNANYLEKYFEPLGTLKLHGKMDMESRNRAVTRFFEESDKKILIATPGVAKEGLTLTIANYAIFYDRSFSLNDWLQAQDRIHRISQEKICKIIHLIAQDSIDLWVDQLLIAKRNFAQIVQGDTIRDIKMGEEKLNIQLENIIKEAIDEANHS